MFKKTIVIAISALGLVAFGSDPDGAAGRPWVQCSANYKMFGHKVGAERPDECGTVGLDGPALDRLYIADGKAETTVTDKFVALNIQAWKSGEEIGGMIRYKFPGRETYAIVVRGPVSADEAQPLSLHSYLGEKTVAEKPTCSFSHYITVNCSVKGR